MPSPPEPLSADSTSPPAATRRTGLTTIFLAFSKIGLTAFGGGMSGWMMRDFVRERRWIDEADFLNGLALSQSFPGTNVVNLAIWIGNRLRGGAGATAAVAGLLGPSLFAAVAILAVFDLLTHLKATHQVLAGVGAAAIGLSLEMALKAARRSATSAFSIAVIAAVFAAVCLFRLPLPLVVAVAAPISIVVAYRRKREG
ncbi:MAG: chromate transporter [Ancalomicrobiaceae bacterium]|nr:chromate transporter [Ancalomicrobiaceae bacterium]